MIPGDKLAAEVREAMLPLQNASENSASALKVRQSKAYTALWTAVERYDRATGKEKR